MHFLFLDPFAAVGGYHKSLVTLGQEFLRLGHSMTFVHCQEAMSTGCTGMNALGVPDEALASSKQEICRLCMDQARASEKLGLWETRWLLPARGPSLKSRVAQIPRLAAYELLLQKKVESIPQRGQFQKIWKLRQKRLREIMPQAEKLLSEKKTDGIVCYNSLYGIHHLFLKIGQKRGIPTLCLHHSFNCAREDEYMLFRGHVFDFLNKLRKNYEPHRPISPYEMRAIQANSQALMAGKKPWAYSSPPKKHETAEATLNYTKKVLVCLSSPDEVFSAQFLGVLPSKNKHVFADQIVWVRWIRGLAQRNPHVLFWIRPHPRLYPNKREGQISELAGKLNRERTRRAPPNFYWPHQEIQGSLWQHLKNTDILFNAWSTIADEFGKTGIPVISFFPHLNNSQFLVDITGKTKTDYERKFSEALKSGKSSHSTKHYIRWLGDFLCTQSFRLKTKPPLIFKMLKIFRLGLCEEKMHLGLLAKKKGSLDNLNLNRALCATLENSKYD